MSYIGNSPALKYASFAVQHFTTSATTGYTLDNAVTNENGIALFINNVRQQPGSSYAYTASGTTLTLSAATTTSDTMYCVFIGKAVQTVNPPAGSVAASQLATDAVTTVKILDTAVTGAKLNDDAISGQGALGAEPADTDEFLVSDAGVLKRVDYSYIKAITQANFLPNAQQMIINSDMAVSQRATTATGITDGGSGYHALDRFQYQEGGSPTAVWTMTQETLTSGNAWDAGFTTALKMDCTTADASLSSNVTERIDTWLEKNDLNSWKKGTTNAEKITLAFWIKATKTGTQIVEFQDQTNDRTCSQAYTVDTTNTWEHKVVNFPADTTGAFGTGNTTGLKVRFWLTAGTEYTSSSLQTTWGAATTAKRAEGQVNNADSTSNNWHLTGVQMEVGEYTSSTLPPFQFESYGDNLARCQRYYTTYLEGNGKLVGMTASYSSSELVLYHDFPTSMRTAPTLELTTGSAYYQHGENNAVEAFTGSTASIDRAHNNGAQWLITSMSLGAGNAGFIYTGSSSSKVSYTAEL
jgi:hypothetical protein